MPCTLQPWEIEIEERRKNEREYGIDLADRGLITRLLCEACGILERDGYFSEDEDQSPELKLWWEGHKKQDAKKKGEA